MECKLINKKNVKKEQLKLKSTDDWLLVEITTEQNNEIIPLLSWDEIKSFNFWIQGL
jgi:hypothetical protein